jgi:hypothetical protein
MTEDHQDYLQVTTSDRGLDQLPPILGSYGDRLTGSSVRVYESSSARGPHVWLCAEAPVDLNRPDGLKVEASVHLTEENAWHLAEQIMYLVRNHYQRDGP